MQPLASLHCPAASSSISSAPDGKSRESSRCRVCLDNVAVLSVFGFAIQPHGIFVSCTKWVAGRHGSIDSIGSIDSVGSRLAHQSAAARKSKTVVAAVPSRLKKGRVPQGEAA